MDDIVGGAIDRIPDPESSYMSMPPQSEIQSTLFSRKEEIMTAPLLAGIGAGLVVVGIPISSSANKNAQKAVELYNSSLEEGTSTKIVTQIKIIGNREGVGLSISF